MKKMSTVSTRWLCLGAAIALSACSGSKPSRQFGSDHANTSPSHDADMAMPSTGDTDTDFLSGMIPHHEGAIEMARAELASGKDPKIRALATQVIANQKAEIERMQTWLAERQAAKKAGK